jgi:hypothetical protein
MKIHRSLSITLVLAFVFAASAAACSGETATSDGARGQVGASGGAASSSGTGSTSGGPTTDASFPPLGEGPPAGNPNGQCAIPTEGVLANVSNPRTVVGSGTKESCTSDAFVAAVAKGGVITFSCGPDPVTIVVARTAKIVNDTGPEIVIDGGGKVTLSGGGQNRILYMNTCDEAQKWTTASCQNQDHPRLTVQNLTFIDANSKRETQYDGGGAIWARGGRLKVINSR